MQPVTEAVFDWRDFAFSRESLIECVERRGFALVRNALPNRALDIFCRRARELMEVPSVAGAPGYHILDYARRTVNPCTLIGGCVLELLLEERMIDLVESILRGECVIGEASLKRTRGVAYEYLPLHRDVFVGWGTDARRLSADQLLSPVAIGCLVYLHDTADGALCYVDGSHEYQAGERGRLHTDQGGGLDSLPKEERERLLRRKVRIEGSRGDVVVFDLRGFHGPDQPCTKRRTALIVHYYAIQGVGFRQLTPLPVWTSDLAALSEKQLRVLGVGASYMHSPDEWAGEGIRATWSYAVARRVVTAAFLLRHLDRTAREWLSRPRRARESRISPQQP